MDKIELFNHFVSKKSGRLSSPALRWSNIKCHPEIYNFMISYFEDVSENYIQENNIKAVEILYRIINDIYEVPKCPICGKSLRVERYDRGYGIFCSDKCRFSEEGYKITSSLANETFIKKYGCWFSKSQEVRDKIDQTNIKKYGGKSPMSSKEVAEKQVMSSKKSQGEHFEKRIEKSKKTLFEKTGYEFPSQDPENVKKMLETQKTHHIGFFNREKIHETNLEKYGTSEYLSSDDAKQKREETLLETKGVHHQMQDKETLKKQKKTMLDKYGYDHNFKNPELIEFLKTDEIRERQWETKKLKGTCNSSKIEDKFYNYLKDLGYNAERNYKDDRYPFHVDFYLKDLDMFIEIQGTWTHGDHIFDPSNEEDLRQVENWKSKSCEINFKGQRKFMYESAIKTWTVSDPLKRETAQKNNLNYLEIFSCDLNICIQQFEQLIEKLKINKLK